LWDIGPDLEKVHLDFYKSILNIKRSTPSAMIYFELGRVPLINKRSTPSAMIYFELVRVPLKNKRKVRILKYWCKLIHTDNCILIFFYKYMLSECISNINCKNWVNSVKHELCSLSHNDVDKTLVLANKIS